MFYCTLIVTVLIKIIISTNIKYGETIHEYKCGQKCLTCNDSTTYLTINKPIHCNLDFGSFQNIRILDVNDNLPDWNSLVKLKNLKGIINRNNNPLKFLNDKLDFIINYSDKNNISIFYKDYCHNQKIIEVRNDKETQHRFFLNNTYLYIQTHNCPNCNVNTKWILRNIHINPLWKIQLIYLNDDFKRISEISSNSFEKMPNLKVLILSSKSSNYPIKDFITLMHKHPRIKLILHESCFKKYQFDQILINACNSIISYEIVNDQLKYVKIKTEPIIVQFRIILIVYLLIVLIGFLPPIIFMIGNAFL